LEATICPGCAEATRRGLGIRAAGVTPLLPGFSIGYKIGYATARDDDGRIFDSVQQVLEPLIWPPAVGSRVRSRTVAVDEGLENRVAVLMNDLGWFGLAFLDFIVPDDGKPLVHDFNGRFVASFEQVVAAGSNLAVVWASLATGREPPQAVPAADGVRFHWLEGDPRRALVERRGGLARDVLDCLLYARGAAHYMWRRDDPWPGIRYAWHLLSGAMRTLGRLIRNPLQ